MNILFKWLLFNCILASDFNFLFLRSGKRLKRKEQKRNGKHIKLNQMLNGNEEKNVNAYINLICWRPFNKAIIIRHHRIWLMVCNNMFTWVFVAVITAWILWRGQKQEIRNQSSVTSFAAPAANVNAFVHCTWFMITVWRRKKS